VSTGPTVIFHNIAPGLVSDRLQKQAEDEQKRLILDRLQRQAEDLQRQAEDKEKLEIWLTEQRGPLSPWFKKQNEERMQRAEEERKHAEEERKQRAEEPLIQSSPRLK
jgi:dsDNA-binding SOS-regulon protein